MSPSAMTRLRWNDTAQWAWSDAIAHEPLISAAAFEEPQAIMADAGRARQASRETRLTRGWPGPPGSGGRGH